MVEHFNRTMEEMLSKFVAENQQDWYSHLSILMMAYRSAVHETTSFTPCELMFGRQIDLPIDLQFGRPKQESGYQNKTVCPTSASPIGSSSCVCPWEHEVRE